MQACINLTFWQEPASRLCGMLKIIKAHCKTILQQYNQYSTPKASSRYGILSNWIPSYAISPFLAPSCCPAGLARHQAATLRFRFRNRATSTNHAATSLDKVICGRHVRGRICPYIHQSVLMFLSSCCLSPFKQ